MKKQSIEIIRHSLAHIMAMAILKLWPNTKFAIGPVIENGFYYDFDFGKIKISDNDLLKIEKEMKFLIKQNQKFERAEISINEAKKFFTNQPYKLDLINSKLQLKSQNLLIYKIENFIDLCKGPHVKSTKEINPETFKLNKLAGAYWRGDEKNKMLTRIYGLAFATKLELENYLKAIEEAEKRDHKKIGKELDLFSFHSEAPGACFWHPKGMILWNELETLGKNLRKKYEYKEIQTPILAKQIFWETSGHWEHYKESMFHFETENEKYAIKPMDCPFNIKIYQEKQRSYKELPIRYTEIGRVMRNEKSGELNGLFRARHITQDDSHIFLAENQIEKEIITLLKMTREYFFHFRIEPKFYLSTRPEIFIGKIQDWNKAEQNLENALKYEKIKYKIKEKDGAFYGPKIDIDIKDALGRSWQLATIQLDFQLPQRFKIEYIDKNGKKEMPVMIHAAIFGSIERFTGILIEHYAGAFPVWLSPVQVKIISVGLTHVKFCHKLANEFKQNNIRVEVDESDETVGNKIRKAVTEKIPYMLVIGDREMSSDKLAIRDRGEKITREIEKQEFIKEIQEKIKNLK
jgi:threonyl-tRNA synthetase